MAVSTIKVLPHRIAMACYDGVVVNSGYCVINYATGYSASDRVIVQPRYASSSLVGWTATVQQQTGNIYLYIRQGTALPADGSKITFDVIFIKA